MALTSYHTLRKSYFYNFFPVKDDEEMFVGNAAVFGPRLHRLLVEIRDVHPPPAIDPRNPWKIRRTLNHHEIASGKIIVPFNDAFNYVLRYWKFRMAQHVVVWGHKVAVRLLDVTNDENPRKYEGAHVHFQSTPSEDCLLTCMEMMMDMKLKADDNIGLYWEFKESLFYFKLFSRNG